MSDSLVKRLRDPFYTPSLKSHTEAADRIEKLEAALRSIAANSCCDSCREAALVARKALGEKECETCSHYSFKVWGIDRSISGKCFGWGEKSKYVNSDDVCERWCVGRGEK